MLDRENWLNGCEREGKTVFVGSSLHCAGCGACHVVIEDDELVIVPDWPFNEKECPVCGGSNEKTAGIFNPVI